MTATRPKAPSDIPIPTVKHSCAAVRHIEDVSADLDVLRQEVRRLERDTSESTRRLWVRLQALIVLLGAVLPTEQFLHVLGVIA